MEGAARLPATRTATPRGDGALERLLSSALAAILTIIFSWRILLEGDKVEPVKNRRSSWTARPVEIPSQVRKASEGIPPKDKNKEGKSESGEGVGPEDTSDMDKSLHLQIPEPSPQSNTDITDSDEYDEDDVATLTPSSPMHVFTLTSELDPPRDGAVSRFSMRTDEEDIETYIRDNSQAGSGYLSDEDCQVTAEQELCRSVKDPCANIDPSTGVLETTDTHNSTARNSRTTSLLDEVDADLVLNSLESVNIPPQDSPGDLPELSEDELFFVGGIEVRDQLPRRVQRKLLETLAARGTLSNEDLHDLEFQYDLESGGVSLQNKDVLGTLEEFLLQEGCLDSSGSEFGDDLFNRTLETITEEDTDDLRSSSEDDCQLEEVSEDDFVDDDDAEREMVEMTEFYRTNGLDNDNDEHNVQVPAVTYPTVQASSKPRHKVKMEKKVSPRSQEGDSSNSDSMSEHLLSDAGSIDLTFSDLEDLGGNNNQDPCRPYSPHRPAIIGPYTDRSSLYARNRSRWAEQVLNQPKDTPGQVGNHTPGQAKEGQECDTPDQEIGLDHNVTPGELKADESDLMKGGEVNRHLQDGARLCDNHTVEMQRDVTSLNKGTKEMFNDSKVLSENANVQSNLGEAGELPVSCHGNAQNQITPPPSLTGKEGLSSSNNNAPEQSIIEHGNSCPGQMHYQGIASQNIIADIINKENHMQGPYDTQGDYHSDNHPTEVVRDSCSGVADSKRSVHTPECDESDSQKQRQQLARDAVAAIEGGHMSMSNWDERQQARAEGNIDQVNTTKQGELAVTAVESGAGLSASGSAGPGENQWARPSDGPTHVNMAYSTGTGSTGDVIERRQAPVSLLARPASLNDTGDSYANTATDSGESQLVAPLASEEHTSASATGVATPIDESGAVKQSKTGGKIKVKKSKPDKEKKKKSKKSQGESVKTEVGVTEHSPDGSTADENLLLQDGTTAVTPGQVQGVTSPDQPQLKSETFTTRPKAKKTKKKINKAENSSADNLAEEAEIALPHPTEETPTASVRAISDEKHGKKLTQDTNIVTGDAAATASHQSWTYEEKYIFEIPRQKSEENLLGNEPNKPGAIGNVNVNQSRYADIGPEKVVAKPHKSKIKTSSGKKQECVVGTGSDSVQSHSQLGSTDEGNQAKADHISLESSLSQGGVKSTRKSKKAHSTGKESEATVETYTYNHRKARIPHGQGPSQISQPQVTEVKESLSPRSHTSNSNTRDLIRRDDDKGVISLGLNSPYQKGKPFDTSGQGYLQDNPTTNIQQNDQGHELSTGTDNQAAVSGLGSPKSNLPISKLDKHNENMYWDNSTDLLPQTSTGVTPQYASGKDMQKYNDRKLCKAKATSTAMARREPMFRGPHEVATDSVVSAVASAEAEGENPYIAVARASARAATVATASAAQTVATSAESYQNQDGTEKDISVVISTSCVINNKGNATVVQDTKGVLQSVGQGVNVSVQTRPRAPIMDASTQSSPDQKRRLKITIEQPDNVRQNRELRTMECELPDIASQGELQSLINTAVKKMLEKDPKAAGQLTWGRDLDESIINRVTEQVVHAYAERNKPYPNEKYNLVTPDMSESPTSPRGHPAWQSPNMPLSPSMHSASSGTQPNRSFFYVTDTNSDRPVSHASSPVIQVVDERTYPKEPKSSKKTPPPRPSSSPIKKSKAGKKSPSDFQSELLEKPVKTEVVYMSLQKQDDGSKPMDALKVDPSSPQKTLQSSTETLNIIADTDVTDGKPNEKKKKKKKKEKSKKSEDGNTMEEKSPTRETSTELKGILKKPRGNTDEDNTKDSPQRSPNRSPDYKGVTSEPPHRQQAVLQDVDNPFVIDSIKPENHAPGKTGSILSLSKPVYSNAATPFKPPHREARRKEYHSVLQEPVKDEKTPLHVLQQFNIPPKETPESRSKIDKSRQQFYEKKTEAILNASKGVPPVTERPRPAPPKIKPFLVDINLDETFQVSKRKTDPEELKKKLASARPKAPQSNYVEKVWNAKELIAARSQEIGLNLSDLDEVIRKRNDSLTPSETCESSSKDGIFRRTKSLSNVDPSQFFGDRRSYTSLIETNLDTDEVKETPLVCETDIDDVGPSKSKSLSNLQGKDYQAVDINNDGLDKHTSMVALPTQPNISPASQQKILADDRNKSESELRISRSLNMLSLPDWYTGSTRPGEEIVSLPNTKSPGLTIPEPPVMDRIDPQAPRESSGKPVVIQHWVSPPHKLTTPSSSRHVSPMRESLPDYYELPSNQLRLKHSKKAYGPIEVKEFKEVESRLPPRRSPERPAKEAYLRIREKSKSRELLEADETPKPDNNNSPQPARIVYTENPPLTSTDEKTTANSNKPAEKTTSRKVKKKKPKRPSSDPTTSDPTATPGVNIYANEPYNSTSMGPEPQQAQALSDISANPDTVGQAEVTPKPSKTKKSGSSKKTKKSIKQSEEGGSGGGEKKKRKSRSKDKQKAVEGTTGQGDIAPPIMYSEGPMLQASHPNNAAPATSGQGSRGQEPLHMILKREYQGSDSAHGSSVVESSSGSPSSVTVVGSIKPQQQHVQDPTYINSTSQQPGDNEGTSAPNSSITRTHRHGKGRNHTSSSSVQRDSGIIGDMDHSYQRPHTYVDPSPRVDPYNRDPTDTYYRDPTDPYQRQAPLQRPVSYPTEAGVSPKYYSSVPPAGSKPQYFQDTYTQFKQEPVYVNIDTYRQQQQQQQHHYHHQQQANSVNTPNFVNSTGVKSPYVNSSPVEVPARTDGYHTNHTSKFSSPSTNTTPPPPPIAHASLEEVLDGLLALPSPSSTSTSVKASPRPLPLKPSETPMERAFRLLRQACGDSTTSVNTSATTSRENLTNSLGEGDLSPLKYAPPMPLQAYDARANGEVMVKCRNMRCGATAELSEAREYYKTCHNCYTYYCSRECRKAHWNRHKQKCLYSRVNSMCKHVIKKIHDDQDILEELTRMARTGYLSQGRGAIMFVFSSPEEAESFIKHGWQGLVAPPVYVSIQDMHSTDLFGEQVFELMDMCKTFNPELKFVLEIAVIAGRDIPSKSIHRKEGPAIKKCVKLRLVSPSQTRNTPQPKAESDTLILTAVPGSEFTENMEERKAREVCFINIQRQLRQRGVSLRHDFPEVYDKLCSYVADNEHFTPITLFPIDARTRKRFMCLIMPNSEPDIEWMDKPDLLEELGLNNSV